MSIIQRFKKLSFTNALWMLIAAIAMILPQAQVPKAQAEGDCVINFMGYPSVLVAAYGYNPGETGSLVWTTTGCSYLELVAPGQDVGFGTLVSADGQATAGPFTYDYPYTKTYILNGIGDNGQIFASYTFNLTQTAPVCEVTGLNASSTTINLGQSVTLSWTSTNCTSLSLSDGSSSYSVSVPYGSASYTPSSIGTTTYTINGGSSSLSRSISVNDPNSAPACTFTSFGPDPNYIDEFGNASVTWTTSGTDCNVSLRISRGGGYIYYDQGEPNFGTKNITDAQVGDTWTLTYGTGQTASIVMRVSNDCSIGSFTASPSTFSSSGAAVTLSWGAPWCTNVTLRGGEFGSGTNVTAYGTDSGSIVAHPTSTTTYYVDAYNNHNQALTNNVTATLSGPTCRLSLNRRINYGAAPSVTSSTAFNYYGSGPESLAGRDLSQLTQVSCGTYDIGGFVSQITTSATDSNGNAIPANRKSNETYSTTLGSGHENESIIVDYQTPPKIEVK